MIPDSIVQLFAADKMKIFLERSMAVFKSKMAILSPKWPFLGPFDILETGKYKNIYQKWMIQDSIVHIFAANQMKIF